MDSSCKIELKSETGTGRPRGVDVQDEEYVAALLNQCWPPLEDADDAKAEVGLAPSTAPPIVSVQIVEVARPVPMSAKDVATWLTASIELTDWLVARVRETPETPMFEQHAAFLQDAAHRAGYLALPLVPPASAPAAPPAVCGGESESPVSTTPT